MKFLKMILKPPALLMLLLFSLMQWIGIFLTGLAGGILGLLSFLFALAAVASFLLGLSSGSEAFRLLAIGFVLFILPHIAEWIVLKITALRCVFADFIRS